MKKKDKHVSKTRQNANYKATNQRDKNRLAKLARANAKHPNDAQTAAAYVNLYHKLHG